MVGCDKRKRIHQAAVMSDVLALMPTYINMIFGFYDTLIGKQGR